MKRLKHLRYFFRYLSDRNVFWIKKLWIYLVIIYFISPIDFFPDLIPGLGWIDDLMMLLWSVPKLLQTLEEYANLQADRAGGNTQSAANGPTIDGVEYRVHDEN
ncbi:MAG: DUF1232 domain-containing protein [Firmicutes bacterium]|nr:DUF1232 domain-containing protein [Bacillota bacterium]